MRMSSSNDWEKMRPMLELLLSVCFPSLDLALRCSHLLYMQSFISLHGPMLWQGTFSSYVISLPFFTHWVTYHCGVLHARGSADLGYRDIFGYIRVHTLLGLMSAPLTKLCKQCHTLWTDHHVIDLGSCLIHDQDFVCGRVFDALRGLCTVWAVINAFIAVSGDRKMISFMI